VVLKRDEGVFALAPKLRDLREMDFAGTQNAAFHCQIV